MINFFDAEKLLQFGNCLIWDPVIAQVAVAKVKALLVLS